MKKIQNNEGNKNSSVNFVLKSNHNTILSLSEKIEQIDYELWSNPFIKNKLSNENMVYLPVKKKRKISTWYLLLFILLILFYLNSGNVQKQHLISKDPTLQASVLPVSTSVNNLVHQPVSSNVKEKKEKKLEKKNKPDLIKTNVSPKDEGFVIPEFPDLKKKKKIQLSEYGLTAENLRNNYIKRFKKIALEEQKKFGIPVGLTLGLAILNSEFGNSFQARKQNNHFSIKCTENSIPIGKGMSGQDITDGICYTTYSSVWSGFRANSNYLMQKFSKAFDSKVTEKIITKLDQSGYFENKTFTAATLRSAIKIYNLE